MDHERNIRPISGALEMSDVSPSKISSISENLDSEDSDSDGSRLYKTCNAIIASIDSALSEETGWAREDTTTTVRLREVALSLKHWKTSVRWCAPGEDKTKGEGAVELQIYELLKREDRILLKTIETYMDEVSENLEDIRTFFTNNKRGDSMSKESLRTAFLEELETSVYCLSLQLIPLRTLAELKIKPRVSITPDTESQRSSTRVSKTRGNIETDLTPLGVPVTARRGLRPKSDFLKTEGFEPLGASKRRKVSEAPQIDADVMDEEMEAAAILMTDFHYKTMASQEPEIMPDHHEPVISLPGPSLMEPVMSYNAPDLSASKSPDRATEESQPKSFKKLDYELPRIDWLRRSRQIMDGPGDYDYILQDSAQQQPALAQAASKSRLVLEEQYIYSSISKNQTRLLLLMPGRPVDKLHASLLTIDDHDLGSTTYPYSALSYVWGDEKEIIHIVIQNTEMLIRPNLYEALCCLRQVDTIVTLWVDYLCINWSNLQERRAQFQKTPDIFRNAYNVCAWLGTRSPVYTTLESVENFVTKIIEANMGLKSWVKEASAVRWRGLIGLLRTSWFTRRWVIQEIAVAQNATIHWGSTIIDWSDLRDVISILSNKLDPCTQDLTTWSSFDNDLANFSFVDCSASLLIKLTSGLFSEDYNGNLKSTKDLETLVCLASRFVCQDPHDTIYALRSLASEFHEGDKGFLVPKYSEDPIQTYMNFVNWVTKRSQSLDILCRPWAMPVNKVILPSWVRQVNNSTSAGEQKLRSSDLRVGFVGLPGENLYNASGVGKERQNLRFILLGKRVREDLTDVLSPRPRIPRIRSELRLPLEIRGGIVDRVADVIPISGILSRECFKILGYHPQRRGQLDSIIPGKTWRTLVADRTSDGKSLPTYYRRACLDSLIRHADANGHIDIEKALHNSKGIQKEYLARVKDVTSGRILIQGRGKGFEREYLVGLGPHGTKSGDIIAIIYGCSVPVILRKRPQYVRRESEYHSEYELIGEAYIHGCMEGEALRGIEEETFRLV